jgi:toxin ParE1/3/4
VEQADRYYNLIFDEIEYVSANFDSGKNYNAIRYGYRVSKVKSHLIFYHKSEDNIVEIVRILHEMMDIENRLMNF